MADLTIMRGDDEAFDIVVSLGGAPYDLTDITWAAFTAKRGATDDDADALLRKDLQAGVEVIAGAARVTLAAVDTIALAAPVDLVWDLEIRDAAGLAHTVASGRLTILADVTRNPGAQPGSGS